MQAADEPAKHTATLYAPFLSVVELPIARDSDPDVTACNSFRSGPWTFSKTTPKQSDPHTEHVEEGSQPQPTYSYPRARQTGGGDGGGGASGGGGGAIGGGTM